MFETYVITAKTESVLRVLQKLASLMSRRRLKIQEMRITEHSFTLTVQAKEGCAQWLLKQMEKCADSFDLELKRHTDRTAAAFIDATGGAWKELHVHMVNCGLIF